ncbi:arabinose efflux permease family protein [SAR116 cluster alpha proteobacterium HIMB100]|nr:arabinose efflux permease family protein [SAR116 cluster alpha proteobacterium HIMB100]
MKPQASIFTPILISASLILFLSFTIRSSFGVFQIPIAADLGWLRSEFSLAIAIQNLAWGLATPVFGALAERFGDKKAIFLGTVLYAAGLCLSAYSISPVQHQWLEMFVGFGIAGTGFGVVLGVVGRSAAPEQRSLALGLTTAAGSMGQVIGPPLAQYLLNWMHWSSVFLVFAGLILLCLFCLPFMRSQYVASKAELEESLGSIVSRAVRDPSYIMIFIGFFSCGFQLAFVTAHFPAFVTEMCASISPDELLAKMGITSTAALGAVAIGVIGVFNIIGTITAGALGNVYRKKYLLAGIYAGRTLISAWFILVPMTPITVLVFSVVMGSLWLATVPLTSGLVAYLYGLRFMGTLYGLVFFSHQLGSFLGVWLGGILHDQFGSYTVVWWVGVGTGLLSTVVHLPIKETPRTTSAAAAA